MMTKLHSDLRLPHTLKPIQDIKRERWMIIHHPSASSIIAMLEKKRLACEFIEPSLQSAHTHSLKSQDFFWIYSSPLNPGIVR
ncbi:hypothetical protein EON65_41365 [archaeon]|nr:MAG: hypothetical protein EON65_41365 [archaeon]